jgi:hypothetical protein
MRKQSGISIYKHLFIWLKQNAEISVIQNEEPIRFKSNFLRRCIMSKVFIQMLLSIVVAVSAAVGFSPEVKGKVSKIVREAKTFTHEISQSVFHASEVDAELSAEASLESEVEAEAGSETDADLDLDKLPETNLETSLSAESETETEIKTKDVKLDLENEIESQLELEVGLGN